MFKCDICLKRAEHIAVARDEKNENINICINCLKEKKENAIKEKDKERK